MKRGIDLNLPEIIVLTGFMGSGKTTIGMELARLTGRTFIDLDNAIVAETGMSIKDIFYKHGEDFFREVEHKVLKELLAGFFQPLVLGTGGGTLTFQKNWELLSDKHVLTIFLNESFEVIWGRIKNDPHRPLVNLADKDEDIARNAMEHLYIQRLPWYQKADVHLNTHQLKQPDDLLKAILENID